MGPGEVPADEVELSTQEAVSVTWDEPKFIMPDRRMAVFLDRVMTVEQPGYLVLGKTMCFGCDAWCWLDERTFKIVNGGRATPFCIECGQDNPGSFRDKAQQL